VQGKLSAQINVPKCVHDNKEFALQARARDSGIRAISQRRSTLKPDRGTPMKLRYAIAGALLSAYGISAHAYDWLNDWPTKIKTDDGYEFGIKGNYQGDMNDFSGDTTDPVTGKEILADSTTWRRKEFYVYGKAPWGVDFAVGVDFATSPNTWLDNFVRYSNSDIGEFRLGQFKTPVGWEEASPSNAGTFVERALPVQATNMGRRLGADWTYQWNPQWLTTLGYYSGGDLQGDNDGNGPSAHIVFNPIKEKTEVIHLGLAVSRENRDATTDGRDIMTPPSARFRARPEANLTATRILDTGNLKNVDNIDRVGLEGAWIHGPWLVQGEYLHFNADFTDSKPNFSGDGYYVFGAWMLTGESRDYKNGYVGNVKPTNEWGAFEIAARYSSLDLNDSPVLGGKGDNFTVGANWYLGNHWKLQANYVRAHTNKFYKIPGQYFDVDPEVFALRAQIYF
jgi:phosphate-selective porin OprO/OprP